MTTPTVQRCDRQPSVFGMPYACVVRREPIVEVTPTRLSPPHHLNYIVTISRCHHLEFFGESTTVECSNLQVCMPRVPLRVQLAYMKVGLTAGLLPGIRTREVDTKRGSGSHRPDQMCMGRAHDQCIYPNTRSLAHRAWWISRERVDLSFY